MLKFLVVFLDLLRNYILTVALSGLKRCEHPLNESLQLMRGWLLVKLACCHVNEDLLV